MKVLIQFRVEEKVEALRKDLMFLFFNFKKTMLKIRKYLNF